ncbi:hypothetical protein QX204_02360 [Nocardia sp. PE-7]|uniref:toxin-antitoxin system YwqK family antitoxin n=1 Tax=Nocardia sp. PE-7 TaxID=3058426 RepID=UPI00265AF0A8|nr:hypothetical protein [Nocardia sp. PE-7]WKG10365.1 hypothetical protein QX204_02360 [Nocardia sp. PE-7]
MSLFIDTNDPELTTVDGRVYYRGEPFTGETVEYLPDFTEVANTSYENGYREQSCTAWYPDGTRRYSGWYRRGFKYDDWRYWSPDGALVQEDNYDTSGYLRHRRRWDSDGVLIEDFDAATLAKPLLPGAVNHKDPDLVYDQYHAGLNTYHGLPFTGQAVGYGYNYADGPIVEIEWHLDGYRDGPELAWHWDGARHYAWVNGRGNPIGLQITWNQDGTPHHRTIADHSGKTLLQQSWNDNGELTTYPAEAHPDLDHDDPALTTDQAGALRHNGRPFTGRINADTTTQDYRDGYPNGLYAEFDNRKVHREGVNSPTGPIGSWYRYRPDGRISEEHHYDRSHRLLLHRQWDEDGALAAPMTGLALQDNGTARRGELEAENAARQQHQTRKASE